MKTPNNVLWHATVLAEIIKYKGHLPIDKALNKALIVSLISYMKVDKRQPLLMTYANKKLAKYLNQCTVPYRENLGASTPAQMRQSVLAMVLTRLQHTIDNMDDREVDHLLKALMIPKIDLKNEEFEQFVNNAESNAFSVIIDKCHEIRDAEINEQNG